MGVDILRLLQAKHVNQHFRLSCIKADNMKPQSTMEHVGLVNLPSEPWFCWSSETSTPASIPLQRPFFEGVSHKAVVFLPDVADIAT
jgi:hypothetical protein